MRPLCPAPVIRPVRALDHMLVAPEVPALQPSLLAPVDLLPHLAHLVLGDLYPHDDDETPPPPDDGWAARKGTFFVVASVSLTWIGRESQRMTFPHFQHRLLVFAGAACKAQLEVTWHLLEPVFPMQTEPHQANVRPEKRPDHQKLSSLASIKSLSSDSRPRLSILSLFYIVIHSRS